MQNPDVVRSKEDARQAGINCVSLAHLALRELFDYELPSDLLCAEMYLDREHFQPVEHIKDARQGDLAWFGIEHPDCAPEEIALRYSSNGELLNWQEFPVKHVAVHTGTIQAGEPLLLHATHRDGGKNTLWPLSHFQTYPRYARLYGVTRLTLGAR